MRPVTANIKRGTPYGARCCDHDTPHHYWSLHTHKGIDFLAPDGTPVFAAWDGLVTSKSWGDAFGTHLVIDHDHLPDGSPGLWAVYAHLSKKVVKPGRRVKVGQLVGYSGHSGNVGGPHLHFEVQNDMGGWAANRSVDPEPWIQARMPRA